MFGWLILGLAVAVGLAMLYVRLSPVTLENAARAPKPASLGVGDYPVDGGFYAVRAVEDAQTSYAALAELIAATDRTVALKDGIFVTRSKLWGFPDVTYLWIEGGMVHISGHLIYGRSDLNVNRTRIMEWLKLAGL